VDPAALVDFFEERNGGADIEYIVPVETIHGIQKLRGDRGRSSCAVRRRR
jgi:hypothetical protein